MWSEVHGGASEAGYSVEMLATNRRLDSECWASEKIFHFSEGLVDARSGGSKPGKAMLVPDWLVQSNLARKISVATTCNAGH